MDSQILDGMAKAYWADAWASQMEEMQLSGHLSGMEIMDVMPQEIPAKAMEIAKKLYAKIEKDNNIKLEDFTPPGEEDFDKDLFGHYLAMEAMGHGVGWSDDHEDHGLEIPYVEESYELWDDAIAAIKAEYGDEAKEPEQEESVKATAKDLIESVMRGKNPKVVVEMGSSKAGTENAQLPKYLADKLAKMKQGEKVVMSDEDMSTLEALYDTDPDIKHLATMPNPKQHSTKDKWLAYFKK